MIDRSNYEAYIIDYLEGNLDAVQVSELLLFVEQHEDIKAELDLLIQNTALLQQPEPVSFDKSLLKKPAYASVKKEAEELLVARLEGDLDKTRSAQLSRLLHLYPELLGDAELFRQAKLIPDTSIVFENKRALKKQVTVSLFPDWLKAAAVLLMLGAGWLMFKPAQPELVQVAVKHDRKGNDRPADKIADKSWMITNTEQPVSGARSKKIRKEPISRTMAAALKSVINVPASAHIDVPSELAIREPQKLVESAPGLPPVALINTTAHVAYAAPHTDHHDGYLEIPEVIYAGIKAQKEQVLTEHNKPEKAKPAEDARWAALSLFNKLTGADVRIVKTYDKDGSVAGIKIAAGNFGYAKGK